jgi:NAD(P)H-dependent FMN reductase
MLRRRIEDSAAMVGPGLRHLTPRRNRSDGHSLMAVFLARTARIAIIDIVWPAALIRRRLDVNARLQVVASTTRTGRSSLAVADWATERAGRHGEFQPELIDIAEVDLPFFDEPYSPCLGRYTSDHTRRWSAIVDRADAFVFVVAEYNHGYTAPLKNALDYLYLEWRYKPVGFISYGGPSGGLRAVEALMPVVVALGMIPVQDSLAIPFVSQYVDSGGRFHADDRLDASVKSMLDELSDLSAALAPLRARSSRATDAMQPH